MKKKFKLPKDFATKWISALRSGEYKQGLGWLADEDNRYCCLGIAGLLCGIPKEKMEGIGLFHNFQVRDKFDMNIIPKELIGNNNNDSDYNELASKLVEMNDNGDSFFLIADWIEKNVEFYEET